MSFHFFESNKPNEKLDSQEEANEHEKTPSKLKNFGDKAIDLVFKKFSVAGLDNIKQVKENNPGRKFIISASHLHNLDLPAALSALGNEFNLQITGESLLLTQLKYIDKKLLINYQWGRENFTALDYKDDKGGKHGSFNPENFVELENKMVEGKTPWIAAHPFSTDGKMRMPSIGPVYLAAKTKALIIPSALESIGGSSVNMEGPIENIKSFLNRSDAIYHIGQALDFSELDISIIDLVISKRKNNETISAEENEKFINVHKQLKERAEILEKHIAEMLPVEKRRQG